MNAPNNKSKKLIYATVIALPIFLVVGGWMVLMRHHQAPSNSDLTSTGTSVNGTQGTSPGAVNNMNNGSVGNNVGGNTSTTAPGTDAQNPNIQANGISAANPNANGLVAMNTPPGGTQALKGSGTGSETGTATGTSETLKNRLAQVPGGTPEIQKGQTANDRASRGPAGLSTNGAAPAALIPSAPSAAVVKDQATNSLTEINPDNCYTVTFKHKVLASHSSDDECSHHRNLIKLPRMDANPSSICIRVNSTPVRYEKVDGKADEFIIGAVAGHNDVITARYCTGKARCNEGCVYPKQEVAKKDEFLDAIGGGTGDDADPSMAQWEAADAQKNQEVNKALDGQIKKELEDQDNSANRLAANNSKLEVFKDWIRQQDEVTACVSSHAKKAGRSTASAH